LAGANQCSNLQKTPGEGTQKEGRGEPWTTKRTYKPKLLSFKKVKYRGKEPSEGQVLNEKEKRK